MHAEEEGGAAVRLRDWPDLMIDFVPFRDIFS